MSANHVLLQRIELSSASSTVFFSNIPQGYTDLKVNVSARATSANTGYERLSLYVAPNGSLSNLTSKLLLSANPPSSTSYTTGVVGWIPASDAAAATFSFVEMLFTNYSGTTTKPYMIDCISENWTTDFNKYTQSVFSGSCSSTAPITSLKFTVDGSSFAAGSTFSIYGIASVDVVPAVSPKATGGDIIVNDGEYWYHAFLTTGAFKPKSSLNCDALVIAGGGGGFNDLGAGGGAGGYRSATLSLTAQNYPVTVGAGGATKVKGSDSVFSSITSTGGGEARASAAGGTGGSGAGGTRDSAAGGAGNTPSTSPSQGNNGGAAGGGGGWAGGGGGGAGGVGSDAGSQSNGGPGGAGSNQHANWAYVTGTGVSGYYAGGGGGASYPTTSAYGTGGSGGGGTGGHNNGSGSYSFATAGAANTGGGGGGSANGPSTTSNVAGGSGIVIVRYAMA